jgi:CDP-glycerol glycerophosphotransferase (TagB/SpsB family)
MRIGFLFNHYATHQVPHAAPYAFELSRRHADCEVIIACSSQAELDAVQRIATLYPGHKAQFKLLHPAWYYQIVDPIVSRWTFKRKKMVLRNNLDFFRTLDALVAPERHCMKLRTVYGLKNLKMIHTRHGAGDREGGFDDRSGAFDLTLLPGQKYVDRLRELGLLQADGFAVAGWPKFEVVQGLQQGRKRLFDNANPTVVYNPHFDQAVSSWLPMGLQVLDLFAANSQYNLIFAPHVVLFKRDKRHQAVLPEKYRSLPNILIDTDSTALADMTYILAADIYLGDVSSQIYEFLLKPRPCIFLNGHQVAWQDNPFYFHWTLGQVVDDVEQELLPALERAIPGHPQFLARQQEAFAYTFRNESESTAAERGADAIAGFLLPEKT